MSAISFIVLIGFCFALQITALPSLSTTIAPSTTTAPDTIIVDGIDISLLSDEELDVLLYLEDDKVKADIDIWEGQQHLKEILKGNRRQKRALPLIIAGGRIAFSAGRALFKAAKYLKSSRSAGKITRQYQRRGDFRKAVKDFNRLKPTNVKRFSGKNGLSGLQGQIGRNGKYTVKVRNRSSGGRPTMDIYRTNKGSRKILRKVRYNRN